eukprot:gnl/MRDRNA2_/MRDRNA2_93952_c0_seq1.p1 gnl/MRDRNA2_/MRDRNA2_93952_c0~~gnl/MRDRNA2_/MRDRNA2_93952_c0_seq1.p1  ORF type:complete len:626 (+),score=125.12 gnl/MRDRNA2_/MRDRNA2_93952_c0_seq1:121-1998(+)
MEENQNWPFIFTGVASITFATLISYGLFIRARHRQNLELIASSFPNVVNFSLNFMENGTLKFRTLFETNIESLARNPVLAQILSDSRDCCTEERAFFGEPRQKKSLFSRSRCCRRLRVKIWGPQIEWKKASEHLHMAILNELSSRYSQGHFGHGIIGLKIPSTVQPKHTQLDVVSETFCFGLTCEQNKDVRAKKVRVMIVAKDFLRHQVSNSAPEPKLERPGHWVRWRTLLEMRQIMEEEERLRAQGIRRVSRVWEVTLSFMVPRLRATSLLSWQKENVMTNLDSLSKQLRMSSDLMSSCTGQGPRSRQRRPVGDGKKMHGHVESRASTGDADISVEAGEVGSRMSEKRGSSSVGSYTQAPPISKPPWANAPPTSVALPISTTESQNQVMPVPAQPSESPSAVSVPQSAPAAVVVPVADAVQSASEAVSPAADVAPVEDSQTKEQSSQLTKEVKNESTAPQVVQTSSDPDKQTLGEPKDLEACKSGESTEATEPSSARDIMRVETMSPPANEEVEEVPPTNPEAPTQEQQPATQETEPLAVKEKENQTQETSATSQQSQESLPVEGRRLSAADYDAAVEIESVEEEEKEKEDDKSKSLKQGPNSAEISCEPAAGNPSAVAPGVVH